MGFNSKGAMAGAASGASAGAAFGPWGAAIGGVAGAAMGGFGPDGKPVQSNVPVPQPQGPGGVRTSWGSGSYVDPLTGQVTYTSGQGAAGAGSVDRLRNQMLMDYIMGGGDSVGTDLKARIAEATARLKRAKQGPGADGQGPGANDYGIGKFLDENGKLQDISDTNAIFDGRINNSAAKALRDQFQADTGGNYGGRGAIGFGKWVRDFYQKAVNPNWEKYQKPLKTTSGNAPINQDEIDAAQRQLDELMGLQGQTDTIRGGIGSNPIVQMLQGSTGRRSRGAAPAAGDAAGVAGSPAGANFDTVFDDPEKAKLMGVGNASLDKAMGPRETFDWATPDQGLEAMLRDSRLRPRNVNLQGDRLTAHAPSTDLGAYQAFLDARAGNTFENQDAMERDRMAAAGMGFGSRSAIGDLVRRRSLADALGANAAAVMGLRRADEQEGWNREAQAAGHNLNLDATEGKLNFDQGQASWEAEANLRNLIENNTFNRGLESTKLGAALQEQDWSHGLSALAQQLQREGLDRSSNFTNEQIGMSQDAQSMAQRLGLMDWIRQGGNMDQANTLASRGMDLNFSNSGNQVGGSYLNNILQAQLAQLGINYQTNAANNSINANNSSSQTAMLLQALGMLGGVDWSSMGGGGDTALFMGNPGTSAASLNSLPTTGTSTAGIGGLFGSLYPQPTPRGGV